MFRSLALFAAIATTSLMAAETWTVDPVHTWSQFKVKHMNSGFSIGRFNTSSGTLQWDAADPTKSSISITIQADSIDTGRDEASKKRDEHLKSADFLSAKEFPTLTFVSTGFAKAAAPDTYTVTGNFTMRGKTMPITATVVKTGQAAATARTKDIIGFEATFTISRKAFGMVYGEGAIADDVAITFTSEFNK